MTETTERMSTSFCGRRLEVRDGMLYGIPCPDGHLFRPVGGDTGYWCETGRGGD